MPTEVYFKLFARTVNQDYYYEHWVRRPRSVSEIVEITAFRMYADCRSNCNHIALFLVGANGALRTCISL